MRTYTENQIALENLMEIYENCDYKKASVLKFNNSFEIVQQALENLNACRNELCLKCGNYKEEHNDKCKGCRWVEGKELSNEKTL